VAAPLTFKATMSVAGSSDKMVLCYAVLAIVPLQPVLIVPPHVGLGGCSIGPIHFLARWHKPVQGFSFLSFNLCICL